MRTRAGQRRRVISQELLTGLLWQRWQAGNTTLDIQTVAVQLEMIALLAYTTKCHTADVACCRVAHGRASIACFMRRRGCTFWAVPALYLHCPVHHNIWRQPVSHLRSLAPHLVEDKHLHLDDRICPETGQSTPELLCGHERPWVNVPELTISMEPVRHNRAALRSP